MLLATGSGDLFAFKHDPKPTRADAVEAAKGAPNLKAARVIQKAERAKVEKEYVLGKIEFPATIRTTPIVANGVLYVMTEHSLYAISRK